MTARGPLDIGEALAAQVRPFVEFREELVDIDIDVEAARAYVYGSTRAHDRVFTIHAVDLFAMTADGRIHDLVTISDRGTSPRPATAEPIVDKLTTSRPRKRPGPTC